MKYLLPITPGNAQSAKMHVRLKWIASLCVVMILMSQNIGTAQKQATGGINLTNNVKATNAEGREVNFPILFTLYKNNEVVRSAELANGSWAGGGSYFANWKELPVGTYELHCEAVGYGKLIKRIAVASDTPTSITMSTMPAKDLVQGSGPTLSELQGRITQLEKQNVVLQTRLTALEKGK